MTGLLHHDLVGEHGQPALLLHGLGADRRQLLPMAEAALANDYLVIAPDLRGHGDTELGLDTLTFAQLASDVETLLDDLDTTSGLLVVGISMGAAVAAELLSRRHVDIAAVVFIRPAWRWEPNPANLAPFPVIGRLLLEHGASDAGAIFARTDEFATVAATSAKAAEALLSQFDSPRAVDRAQRLISIPQSAPTRPTTDLPPTLVIGSGLDPVHPVSMAQDLHRDLGGELTIVAPRYDAPTDHATHVAATVSRFVRETRTHATTR